MYTTKLLFDRTLVDSALMYTVKQQKTRKLDTSKPYKNVGLT